MKTLNKLTFATALLLGSSSAFAADFAGPRTPATYVAGPATPSVCAPAHIEDVRAMPRGTARQRAINEIDAQCASIVGRGWVKNPPMYAKAPPMVYDTPIQSVCGAIAAEVGGSGARAVRPYVFGAGTYTSKHMNDQATGVDKSDLGFLSPEIGGGVCVGLTPRLGAFGEVSYAFATDSVNRKYSTGWTEKDELSMLIGRLGALYSITDRIAVGGYVAVGQGWLKYDQSLDWYGKLYTANGTSTATFAGIGGQLEYAFTNNIAAFVRGEKLWMVSSVPAGQNKTDMERLSVGVKFSF